MVDINKLVESYYPDDLSWDKMLQIIEEQIDVLTYTNKQSTNLEEGRAGAKSRERVLRLPNVIPTEISVGQKPSSQDRKQFELWMSTLGWKVAVTRALYEKNFKQLLLSLKTQKKTWPELLFPKLFLILCL